MMMSDLGINETALLIAALGGPRCVAEQFQITPQAVCYWIKTNQVPAERQAEMLQLVVRRGLSWRPRNWDKRIELRFNPGRLAAD